ncbi:hypothetical protein L6164_030005 [Bauhinia variegata]|uniref:Uncharacterized protein n=1 Tax=Bauhinia variegata TaxID=167791 RepID=A0ACB9LB14_BAUVA|nr:hypothetical protein L6164_030005 [Bauhinia variegata]
MEFVGKTVQKEVEEGGIVSGTVKSYDPSSGFVEIAYEDGDSEELESSELASPPKGEPEFGRVESRVGRKPKKRRRVDRKLENGGGDSGNESENSEFSRVLEEQACVSENLIGNGELDCGMKRSPEIGNWNGGNRICSVEIIGNANRSVSSNGSDETVVKGSGMEGNSTNGFDLNAGINLNEDLNLNDGCSSLVNSEDSLKRRECIDLNLDVRDEFDVNVNVSDVGCSALGKMKRECDFDLNVEVCDEDNEVEDDAGGGVQEEVMGAADEDVQEEVKGFDGDVQEQVMGSDGDVQEQVMGSDGDVQEQVKGSDRDVQREVKEADGDVQEEIKEADGGVQEEIREADGDANGGVQEEVKEADGGLQEELREADGREGQSDIGDLFAERGRSQEGEADINQKPIEEDSVIGKLNDITNDIKLKVIHGSPECGAKDSLSLIEGKEDGLHNGNVAAIDSQGVSNAISVKGCDSMEVQQEYNPSQTGIGIIHEHQADPGSSCKQVSSRRKRRKLSDKMETTTGTVLRRSSRRASARQHVSSTVALDVTYDPSLSLGLGALAEDKPIVSGSEKFEQCDVLPLKLQLPPSSQNLNLDNIPVLELFSIYACLRSFSTILILSPFELEDFVAVLKCATPSILFDSIHVSILKTLRKHLEYLSNDGCQSASLCLRNLNWDMLDLVTWPIFLAEYLLVHGLVLNSGFDLSHLMFVSDYHKQPVSVKVQILQCLCDDMIEAETIRSELNRRSSVTETDMNFDQNMYFDISKKRKALMDVSGGSCLSEEIVDDTTDWNSDECCLCKMDGNLICCDGCPAAFHSRCVGVANDHLPEGDWYCPECAIGRRNPWMKPLKSLRGADLLGIDLHGRLYFNCCGYLLVSDSSDTGSLFNYYHRNDLNVVIEVLKSADTLYADILTAIYNYWDIAVNMNAGATNLNVLNQSACKNMHMKEEYSAISASLPPFSSSETCLNGNESYDHRKLEGNSNVGCHVHLGQEFPLAGKWIDSMTTIESPCIASEASGETTELRSSIENLQTHRPHDFNRSDESLNLSSVKHRPVGDCSLTSSSLDLRDGKVISIAGKGDAPEVPYGTDYINYYSFARTASLIAEELMCKTPEKINKNVEMSEEDIISEQGKVIMKKSTNFCWPSIQNLNADAQKEKCGWCFSCKGPYDDRDCLFNAVVRPIWEVSKSNLIGLQPRKNQNGHLRDVISQSLSLEDRLGGLLSGPWLNPHHSKLWRKDLLKASDVASVKHLLLMLEFNLQRRALSADWLKHVDSVVTMGSASHIVVSSSRTSSRLGIGRKRARYSDIESNSSSNTTSGLGIYWWRGGRVSRHLFNWKVLPRPLAAKAARQAGCTKISGILYPENSDFARRSKYVAWRASVETSTSVEQLALQVRELDSNIRWNDIENTHPLCVLDKESRKSIRLFKKAIVRRKHTEGESVKYLLDFGKRRAIPDIVIRHGSLLEQPSSERKKYWLDESHVPLHLLKNFEEKRIARKSNGTKSEKSLQIDRGKNMFPRQRGLSYLFSRLEKLDYQQCGQCNRDVPISEAVTCQICKGYFHKRHVRGSGGTVATNYTYSCRRCQEGMHVKTNAKRRKVDPKLGKVQSQKCKRSTSLCRSAKGRANQKSLSKGRQVKSRNKKSVPSVPLRRSARNAKCLSLQNKRKVGRKKGKKSKPKKVTPRKPKENTAQCKKSTVNALCKKRTHVYNSYWLNGLRLSRKPNDERVVLFGKKKHLAPCEDFSGTLDHPKCQICCGDGCALNYIACEICGEWFHGDAFGLTIENARQLIGFRCHVCRDRAAPICPHMKRDALSPAESNSAIECTEELSNPVPPQPLSEVC